MNVPAVLLFQQGLRTLASAYAEVRQAQPGETVADFDGFLEAIGRDHGAIALRLRDALPDSEVDLDRLPALELLTRCEDLVDATRHLLEHCMPMSQEQQTYGRYLQTGSWMATVIVLLATLAYFAFRPANIAQNKSVTASSVDLGTHPQAVVDGKNYGSYGFHSATEPNPWLRVDLGREYHLTEVQVFGRHDCCYEQSVPMVLEVSLNGESFNAIATRDQPFEQVEPWVVSAHDVVARFVRLRLLRESVLVLSEVEVYGWTSN
jgi:hypothetical protein